MALYCSPDYQTSFDLLAFQFKRRTSIQIFKMAAMVAILDFQSEWLKVQKKKSKINFQHGC